MAEGNRVSFSTLLIQLFQGDDTISQRELCRRLKANGTPVSYAAVSSYKAFETVPSYERARAILDVFGYQISQKELMDILDYSRETLKGFKQDDRKDMRQGVRLVPSKFKEGLSADELDNMITRRYSELNIENNFNSYVTYLIYNDLKNSGYLED